MLRPFTDSRLTTSDHRARWSETLSGLRRDAALTAVAITGIQVTNVRPLFVLLVFILGESVSVSSGSKPDGRAIFVMLPTLFLQGKLQGSPHDPFLSAGIQGPTYRPAVAPIRNCDGLLAEHSVRGSFVHTAEERTALLGPQILLARLASSAHVRRCFTSRSISTIACHDSHPLRSAGDSFQMTTRCAFTSLKTLSS